MQLQLIYKIQCFRKNFHITAMLSFGIKLVVLSLIQQSMEFECSEKSSLNSIIENTTNSKIDLLNCDADLLTNVSFNNPWITQLNITRDNSKKAVFKLDEILCGPDLKTLGINSYEIKTLTDKIFWDCVSLTNLALENCGIANISEDAFYGLTSLEVLNLTQNNIQELLEKVFWPLVSLRGVKLDQNPLKNISNTLFDKNQQLIGLELNYANLTTIPEVPTLQYLHIMGNNLKTVNISDINRVFHIGYNSIEKLICHNITEKEAVDFRAGNNKLSDFHCIKLCSHLVYLNISNNNFTHFELDWFDWLEKLQIFDICGNPLVNFDPTAITKPLKNVQCFCFNQMQNYTSLVTLFPNLKTVYITNRPANITKYRFFGEYLKYTAVQIINYRCNQELNSTMESKSNSVIYLN